MRSKAYNNLSRNDLNFLKIDVQKIYDGTPILSNQFVRKTTSTLNSSVSTQQQETIRSMDAVNARILSSMILASIGITSPASIPDIRAGYEAYTNQLSLTHIGDSVEQRLDALSEQRLLSRAGIKFKVRRQSSIDVWNHNIHYCRSCINSK